MKWMSQSGISLLLIWASSSSCVAMEAASCSLIPFKRWFQDRTFKMNTIYSMLCMWKKNPGVYWLLKSKFALKWQFYIMSWVFAVESVQGRKNFMEILYFNILHWFTHFEQIFNFLCISYPGLTLRQSYAVTFFAKLSL